MLQASGDSTKGVTRVKRPDAEDRRLSLGRDALLGDLWGQETWIRPYLELQTSYDAGQRLYGWVSEPSTGLS